MPVSSSESTRYTELAPAPALASSLAFETGYADQSHRIREFKALAGTPPASFLAERHGVGFVQYDEPESGVAFDPRHQRHHFTDHR